MATSVISLLSIITHHQTETEYDMDNIEVLCDHYSMLLR